MVRREPMNDMTRKWTNSAEGKKMQYEIFRYLYENETEFKGNERFAWFDIDSLSKLLLEDGIEFQSEFEFGILTHDKCVRFAVYRLYEHKYLEALQFSRGFAYRINNNGKQAFEMCEAKKDCLKYIQGQTAEELIFNWSVRDLNDFAKKLRIKSRSKMTKPQLAMAIEDVINA